LQPWFCRQTKLELSGGEEEEEEAAARVFVCVNEKESLV
jgi:hypothetical protein